MLTETDAEDTFGAHGKVATHDVRLVVGGIAGLDPYPHLVLSGCNLHLLRVWAMRSAKQAELLLRCRLELSMEHRLIVNPHRNIGLFEAILHLNENSRSVAGCHGRSWRTNSGRWNGCEDGRSFCVACRDRTHVQRRA